APLVSIGLFLSLYIPRLDVGQFAILLLRHPHFHFDRFLFPVELVPVPEIEGAGDQKHGSDLDQGPAQVAELAARHADGRTFFAFRFCTTQQIDSDHSFSKLLRAKPTATANWPAFCSTSSAPAPSAGASTFWNGLNNSTGIENSWRSAS